MNKNEGAAVYFIDPESLFVRSITVMKYELKGGASYATEALWKMPEKVEHYIEPILFGSESNLSEIARIRILYDLADKLRNKKLDPRIRGDDEPKR